MHNPLPSLIISGGSSGIGRACIQKFLTQNYQVYNLDIQKNLELSATANYTFIQTDLRSETEIRHAIDQIKAKQTKIATLIVNAGQHLAANIEATPTAQLMAILSLNLLGAWHLIKYTLPLLKANGGSIISIGSDQSSIAKPNSAAYGMTKAALAHLTKSTALDYAKYNIRANCIGAGTIDTPLYQQAIRHYAQRSGLSIEQLEANEAKLQPIGRIGQASEVAELAYFLALEQASYITGALIPVDGGYISQ